LEINLKKDIEAKGEFTSLVVITGLLITSYLTANIMAVKLISLFGVALFDAGTLTFPLAYVLGDVLTEIWGFRIARKVIFLTFFCNILLVLATYAGARLPSPDYMQETADAYSLVFNYVPRVTVASALGFLSGELVNAYFLEKIKIWTKGRFFWLRAIGSTVAGYAFDTILFVFVAFYKTARTSDLLTMIVAQYGLKLAVEAVAGTPLAYGAVRFFKKKVRNEAIRENI
jgi:uncharacterized integral membrane protein (TIGR00697 family)